MSYITFVTQSGPLAAYTLTAITIFAETGLLIGFFLPGDSLLFGLGILAANHTLGFYWILLVGIIAGIVGESVGYAIGKKSGHALFNHKTGFFSKKQLSQVEYFYTRYGTATVILSRFIPIIRTFVPLVAGAAEMPYRQFLIANVAGAVIWIGGVTAAGYYLGHLIPNLDHYINLIVLGVVAISLLTMARHLLTHRKAMH